MRDICWVLLIVLPLACGAETPDRSGTGGTPATGGAPATGGTPGTGGTPATGGASATGGTGGMAGTGGQKSGGSGGHAGNHGGGGHAGGGHAGGGGHPATGGTGGHAGDGGHPATGGSGGGSGFAAVLAVFSARCTICHDATLSGLPTYPSLSLTTADAYAALVNKPADETCGGMRVVPGSPSTSYLVQKVTQDAPCDGQRMPRPFEVSAPSPLTAAEIATITSWISAGASR